MKTELLAPAGSFEILKDALYSGADAIYCAGNMYGARAYAKNLSLQELDMALDLAHTLGKKIYVTVNTMLFDYELKDCYHYLDTLYELGVDAIIATDFSVINYIINYLPQMECHVSTQSGVKDLEDVLFFENLKAKRCVLAREMSYQEIAEIKKNTDMPLEVFAHGALCVSYSGGCLMSSFLSLRSGNRGRCSQNCRRSYTIYKNGSPFSEEGFHLSMKDLNVSSYIKNIDLNNIDSLKLEGRMKNNAYVSTVTKEYRQVLDDKNYLSLKLDSVFHRPYTKGFLNGEDSKNIVDYTKKNNEGEDVATVISWENEFAKINATKEIHLKDRIKIRTGNEDNYFNIDVLYNESKKEVSSLKGIGYLKLYKKALKNTTIFRMINVFEEELSTNEGKLPIKIILNGSIHQELRAVAIVKDKEIEVASSYLLDEAKNKPLLPSDLEKQFKKLNETCLYLKDFVTNLKDNCFTTVANLNELRRMLVKRIYDSYRVRRKKPDITYPIKNFSFMNYPLKLGVFCSTKAQYEAAKELGVEIIYYENYIPYVNAKYQEVNETYVLAGNYGGLEYYKNKKDVIIDYSFNCANSDALYYLYLAGAKRVCVSLEMSYEDIVNLVKNYQAKYYEKPNLEIIAYGHINLMTTKYCPLKVYNLCGKCNDDTFELRDEYGIFPIMHTGCITHILNGKSLNLMDELPSLKKLASVIRINLTIEDKDESLKIIKQFQKEIEVPTNTKYFNSETQTRGYFKRKIQ